MTKPSKTCLPFSRYSTLSPQAAPTGNQELEEKPRFPQLAHTNTHLSHQALVSASNLSKICIFCISALFSCSKSPTKLVCFLGQPDSFLFLVYLGLVVSHSISSHAALNSHTFSLFTLLHVGQEGNLRLWLAVDLFVFKKKKKQIKDHNKSGLFTHLVVFSIDRDVRAPATSRLILLSQVEKKRKREGFC